MFRLVTKNNIGRNKSDTVVKMHKAQHILATTYTLLFIIFLVLSIQLNEMENIKINKRVTKIHINKHLLFTRSVR